VEEIEHILRDFGLILGAGLVSQLIATVIRLPQMVVRGRSGSALAQPPAPARKVLVHQLVYEAVGGYNEGVQVYGCLTSVCMGVWSPSMVDEPVDPGHKLAHGVS
jgi:hypothetical protein